MIEAHLFAAGASTSRKARLSRSELPIRVWVESRLRQPNHIQSRMNLKRHLRSRLRRASEVRIRYLQWKQSRCQKAITRAGRRRVRLSARRA
jgi:hypothetical protein